MSLIPSRNPLSCDGDLILGKLLMRGYNPAIAFSAAAIVASISAS
jgi:hypothetical protein